MLILNFTYPLRCRRVPLGVRVPPAEYHWVSGPAAVRRCYAEGSGDCYAK
jgi:hypothetical protein